MPKRPNADGATAAADAADANPGSVEAPPAITKTPPPITKTPTSGTKTPRNIIPKTPRQVPLTESGKAPSREPLRQLPSQQQLQAKQSNGEPLKKPTSQTPKQQVPKQPRVVRAAQPGADGQPAPKKVKVEKPPSPVKVLAAEDSTSALAAAATLVDDGGVAAVDADSKPRLRRSYRGAGSTAGGMPWALSTVRAELDNIQDVEGVADLQQMLPEVVLLGGIAARRELLSALLGEHGHAQQAAAVLVPPGMRQPLALELRCSPDGIDLEGRESDDWLQGIEKKIEQGQGTRLKLEPLRMPLWGARFATLDVVDLPENLTGSASGVPPKIEEMRSRYLAPVVNILVCLEPGAPQELCQRFDPHGHRTVLIGAAAESGGSMPASELMGTQAARDLEERFAQICNERAQHWLAMLERLERRLSRSVTEAVDAKQREDAEALLQGAKLVGVSFGRALEQVFQGTAGCSKGALTMLEELREFADAAAQGKCGAGSSLSPEDAAEAAADLFAPFGGVEKYAAYLEKQVCIAGAEEALNGGAAWQRMLAEIDVAMHLAHPPAEALEGLVLSGMRCAGTGVHGHQRWEDVSSKLMLSISFKPLTKRIRYVAARVAWLLRKQSSVVVEWMVALSEGPLSRCASPLFAEHLALLRSSQVTQDLVFGAYRKAAEACAEQIFKNLQGTLTAGCLSPNVMLRPQTLPDMDPKKLAKPTMTDKTPESRIAAARTRVKAEMILRETRDEGPAGGLPLQLRDKVFEPSEALSTMGHVEVQLRRAFAVLAGTLANQAFAFADTEKSSLCRRHLDEAMGKLDFAPEQRKVMEGRCQDLQTNVHHVQKRLEAVRRCLMALKSVHVVR
eukprot:TRINITY_DN11763_c0_g1_i2.p1 TRINITY_DN11763_c0_g1~~TRINITY_DN11763_c0_g1_i2.p1  ORF type:complete len:848 (-),score=220.53 TRINITY_DN11763_c0_g1_i2:324-2867(-)